MKENFKSKESEMKINEPIKENRKYKKRPKLPKTCVICGRASLFKYYNAQSCDGCKQFFRRAVVGHRTFRCRKFNSCLINNEEMLECRACRLDKCLLAGMDPTLVETEQTHAQNLFIQSLQKHRKMIQQKTHENDDNDNTEMAFKNDDDKELCDHMPAKELRSVDQLSTKIPANLSDKSAVIHQTICSMNSVEQQIRTFIGIRREFYDGFFAQFSTLSDYMHGIGPIINNPDKFVKAIGEFGAPDQIYKTVAKCGNFYGKNILLLFEIVSVIDLLFTMPHFQLLETNDQTTLLSFVAIPLIELSARFYSSKIQSPIVTSIPNNSFSPLFLYFNNPFYGGDQTVQSMAESIYAKSMEPFNKLQLSDEEFLLLRALMSSHSAVSGLSMAGRHTLQQWSAHYADLLMHHLRTKHGNLGGARRFADVVHLAEIVFFSAKRHREFFTYLAMVTDQGRFHAAVPAIFMPMVLHGMDRLNCE